MDANERENESLLFVLSLRPFGLCEDPLFNRRRGIVLLGGLGDSIDDLDNGIDVERLFQVEDVLLPDRLLGRFVSGPADEDEGRGFPEPFLCLVDELDTVHAGQQEIGDDERESRMLQVSEAFFRGIAAYDVVTEDRFQKIRETVPDQIIIFN